MKKIEELKVKIFADGADKSGMLDMYKRSYIKGLTTNPTLMKKAGIQNYRSFCIEILEIIKSKPISFEVFSDNLEDMERQAIEISSWGENVYVKIPITNTKGVYTYKLIQKLSSQKIKINVTAIMTLEQVRGVIDSIDPSVSNFISIFAGRIADTGVDPLKIMSKAVELVNPFPLAELIWASPRELLNIIQADQVGCHVITATSEILNKLPLIGYDLNEYSLDTVKMFYKDAVTAGFEL